MGMRTSGTWFMCKHCFKDVEGSLVDDAIKLGGALCTACKGVESNVATTSDISKNATDISEMEDTDTPTTH